MKKESIPLPVAKAAQPYISSYGGGVDLIGKCGDFDVYAFSAKDEPEIGAVRFLYKKGEEVITLNGMEAMRFVGF